MGNKLFQQQVAIVSGAGKGIGFAIARALALQGASVVLNDIDIDLAITAANIIKAEGGLCEAFGGDISEMENIEGIVKFTVDTFGKLDILLANAGITTYGDFLEYQPASMQRLLPVSYTHLTLPTKRIV